MMDLMRGAGKLWGWVRQNAMGATRRCRANGPSAAGSVIGQLFDCFRSNSV